MITIPTIAQLNASIKQSIETQFNNNIPDNLKSFLRALIAVQAGKLKELYLTVGNTQKNIWPDTAESTMLIRWGLVKLGRPPFPAVAGQYQATVTGTVGETIPASTTFKSDDTSLSPDFLFILDEAYTLTSNPDTITVRALTAGIESKLSIGDTLTATAPIALVDSEATVTVEAVEPLAAEDIEAYRTAILNSFRLEPQGGAATDYRIWAADAQGVAKVYPYAKTGYTSEIDLFVEATIADSIDGKGTPSAQLLLDVEDVVEFNPDQSLDLNERGRRPLQAIVNYNPVTIKEIIITITGFVGITPAQQALLLSAFTSEIAKIRPFVSGADDIISSNDLINTNKLNAIIYNAIPGAVYTGVTFTVDGVPLTAYQFVLGNIPYLDSVVYA